LPVTTANVPLPPDLLDDSVSSVNAAYQGQEADTTTADGQTDDPGDETPTATTPTPVEARDGPPAEITPAATAAAAMVVDVDEDRSTPTPPPASRPSPAATQDMPSSAMRADDAGAAAGAGAGSAVAHLSAEATARQPKSVREPDNAPRTTPMSHAASPVPAAAGAAEAGTPHASATPKLAAKPDAELAPEQLHQHHEHQPAQRQRPSEAGLHSQQQQDVPVQHQMDEEIPNQRLELPQGQAQDAPDGPATPATAKPQNQLVDDITMTENNPMEEENTFDRKNEVVRHTPVPQVAAPAARSGPTTPQAPHASQVLATSMAAIQHQSIAAPTPQQPPALLPREQAPSGGMSGAYQLERAPPRDGPVTAVPQSVPSLPILSMHKSNPAEPPASPGASTPTTPSYYLGTDLLTHPAPPTVPSVRDAARGVAQLAAAVWLTRTGAPMQIKRGGGPATAVAACCRGVGPAIVAQLCQRVLVRQQHQHQFFQGCGQSRSEAAKWGSCYGRRHPRHCHRAAASAGQPLAGGTPFAGVHASRTEPLVLQSARAEPAVVQPAGNEPVGIQRARADAALCAWNVSDASALRTGAHGPAANRAAASAVDASARSRANLRTGRPKHEQHYPARPRGQAPAGARPNEGAVQRCRAIRAERRR